MAEGGPGHFRALLLVTDEGRFPLVELVHRWFPNIVQQRGEPRDQLRRGERRGE